MVAINCEDNYILRTSTTHRNIMPVHQNNTTFEIVDFIQSYNSRFTVVSLKAKKHAWPVCQRSAF